MYGYVIKEYNLQSTIVTLKLCIDGLYTFTIHF